jgi:aminoglycoside phosphotransferase (APT) family kinase protein
MTDAVPGLSLDGLNRYVRAHLPDVSGPVTARIMYGGRSNLTYQVIAGDRHWVLRRSPMGGLTPSAHDIGREYRVVAALNGTRVPVARTVALCEDPSFIGVPFSIIEFVAGRVIRSRQDLDAYGDDELSRCALGLVDTLADLHSVPYAEVGLAHFGRPRGFLGRQVSRWYDQWCRVATRDLPDLVVLHTWLANHVPTERRASIVHGDFRIDNAIVDEERIGTVRAIVDWEMAALGDPLADLGLHLAYRDPAFEPVLAGSAAAVSDRLPSARALADRYARTSGHDVDSLNYHLALGYFKIAVIAEGIHGRHVAGDTVGEGFDMVGQAVPELIAGGLRAMTAGVPG